MCHRPWRPLSLVLSLADPSAASGMAEQDRLEIAKKIIYGQSVRRSSLRTCPNSLLLYHFHRTQYPGYRLAMPPKLSPTATHDSVRYLMGLNEQEWKTFMVSRIAPRWLVRLI